MISVNRLKYLRKKSIPYDRIIFLHIQKTAGTSVSEHILKYLWHKRTMRWGDYLTIPKSELMKYYYISGHFGFDYIKNILDGSYSFTFLRNPVERILSYYTFSRQLPLNEQTKKFRVFDLIHQMTFKEFVESDNPLIKLSIDNLQTWLLACNYSNAIREKLKNVPEHEILGMAKENLSRLSYVGFKETFKDDFNNILSDLHLPIPARNKVAYKSKSPISIKTLSPDVLQKLQARVSLDNELYNYAWNSLRKKPACPIEKNT